jgi:hypothetical protein
MPRHSSAPVHTPDELLVGARRLLETDDPVVRRAAVLEAITALEAFVHQQVFAVLRERLDPLLVKWLEDKTRMDFDSRLSVLTPIATGLPVDQQADLWNRYKRAKSLRNAVTHSGRKVSVEDANGVLQTVHDWLAYLASSVEVDSALAEFKREVELGRLTITDERSASQAIANYFSRSAPAAEALELTVSRGFHADVVLRFGNRLVVIEIKFLRTGRAWDKIVNGVKQIEGLMAQANAERGALVVFSHEALPPNESHLTTVANGKISIISVQIPH